MTTKDERDQLVEGDETHGAKRIEEDHRSLREQLDAIAVAATHEALLAELLALPKVLREHFDREEQVDGIYDDMQSRLPSLAPRLVELRGEHRTLVDDLEELCRQLEARARAEQGAAEVAEPVRSSTDRWIQRLRRHERDESSMMGDVYYTDEGGHG